MRRQRSMQHVARRVALATVMGVVGALLAGTGVATAAPTNDDFADRGSLAFDTPIAVDLTDATNEPADQQVFDECRDPAAVASVWFELPSVPAGTLVAVEVSRASTAGAPSVYVVSGAPGSFTLEACGGAGASDGLTGYEAAGGTTYYLAVADRRGLTGTKASIRLSRVEVRVTGGAIQPDGTVNVTGTFTCPAGRTIDSLIILSIHQKVANRAMANGGGVAELADAACGGPVPWTVPAKPFAGRISGGSLTVDQMYFELCLSSGGSCFSALLPEVTFRITGARTEVGGPVEPPFSSLAVDITGIRGEVTIMDTALFKATLANAFTVDAAGSVTARGHYSCPAGADTDFATIILGFDQVVGRGVASASGGIDVEPTCDGVSRPWTFVATSYPDNRIRGGQIAVYALGLAVVEATQQFEESPNSFLARVTANGGKG